MTNSSGILERAVVRSSVMPSLKYSWLRSPLMLAKGKTAIEGLSGSARAATCAEGIDAAVFGGRNERGWTNPMTGLVGANPASEKTPRPGFGRDRTRPLARV